MDYTVRESKSFNGGLLEVWNTYRDGYVLADIEYRDGNCTVAVYDPTTSRSRYYQDRPTVKAQAIVERHLKALGYKNRVEFHKLDGTVELG